MQRLVAELQPIAALSVVTLVELHGGAAIDGPGSEVRRRAIQRMEAAMPILDFGIAEARIYGNIVRQLGFARSQVIDRMIAATAIRHGVTLITFNTRDFRRAPDLRLWSLDV